VKIRRKSIKGGGAYSPPFLYMVGERGSVMVKLTLNRVLAAREAMKIVLRVADAKLTARLGIKLARISKELKPHQDLIDETMNKVILKYGVKDEKTGETRVPAGTPEAEKANAEIKELLESEVELNVTPVEIPEDVGGIPSGAWLDLEGLITTKE